MRRTTILLVTGIIICLCVAGCGGGGTVTPPEGKGDDAAGGSGLTSSEAARIAAPEARKWSVDAVLWEIGPAPQTLDADWTDNGRAGEWFVSYARPSDERCFRSSAARFFPLCIGCNSIMDRPVGRRST